MAASDPLSQYHDDRYGAPIAEAAHNVEGVDTREPEVDDDDVGEPAGCESEGLITGPDHVYFVPAVRWRLASRVLPMRGSYSKTSALMRPPPG